MVEAYELVHGGWFSLILILFDHSNVSRYVRLVIRSFVDSETELIWNEDWSKRLPPNIQQRALNKLALLNRAATLADLRAPPGSRLQALSGDCAGQYAIRINDQWRLCFEWSAGDAWNVEICDYH